MPTELQLALWGLAVLLPFLVNAAFGRNRDALGMSGMLIVGWAIERLSWAIWSPPEAMQFYCMMDFAMGATAYSAWLTQREAWKLILARVFLVQIAIAVIFWRHPAANTQLIYIVANNILFAIELCLAAYPGARDGVAILARAGVLHRPRPDRFARH